MDHPRSQTYRSWLLGEILLVCLLASGTALFAASDSLKSAYELHDARLAFDTAVAVVAIFFLVFAYQLGTYFYRNRPGRYRPDAIPSSVLPRT